MVERVLGAAINILKTRTVLFMFELACPRLNLRKMLVLVAATLLAAISPAAFGLDSWQLHAQTAVGEVPSTRPSAVPEWQREAGGKMEFEVASIRQNNGEFVPPNFVMDTPDDAYVFTGGLFIADFPLEVYIEFAYKFWPTSDQIQAMLAHLPKWVTTDNFEIRARAAGNPTEDQMRLMVQSLLADRFGLVVHFETQETSVLAMTLIKPGRLGPMLRPHADGPSCDVPVPNATPGTSPKGMDVFPPACGVFQAVNKPNHVIKMGARNTTMEMVAHNISEVGHFGRPVVDETGLSGRFDFTIEWTRQPNNAPTAGADAQVDLQGTTFTEAVQEQLGLKFKTAKAPLKVIVIDHVQRPSEN